MKTNNNSFLILPVIPAISCSVFTLLIYKTYLAEIITQNPIIWKTVVPISFIVCGVSLALFFIFTSTKNKSKSFGFAPYGAIITSILTIFLGIVTPYRINLIVSYKNLLIQTMNIVTGILSGVIFTLLLSFSAITAFSCILSVSNQKFDTAVQKTINAISVLLSFVFISVSLYIQNKTGCSNTLIILGTVCFFISLIYTITNKLKSKH